MFVRGIIRQQLRDVLRRRARPGSELFPRGRTIVFAPHPDDETLGCGGVISGLRSRGAEVWVVVLTDGGGSHPSLPPAELAALRAEELRAATRALGVSDDHLVLLGFPDGHLGSRRAEATERVRDLLTGRAPEDVMVPTRRDSIADHQATNDVVLAAARAAGRALTVWEYPIWFWRHWPWTGLDATGERGQLLRDSARARFGLTLLSEFTTVVDVSGAIARKRAALAAHATQTQRRNGDPGWAILADVSGGDFLDCFFQGYEVFKRYRWSPG